MHSSSIQPFYVVHAAVRRYWTTVRPIQNRSLIWPHHHLIVVFGLYLCHETECPPPSSIDLTLKAQNPTRFGVVLGVMLRVWLALPKTAWRSNLAVPLKPNSSLAAMAIRWRDSNSRQNHYSETRSKKLRLAGTIDANPFVSGVSCSFLVSHR
jgi:hypothetical protein